jgi:hypothetical protein
MVTYLPTDFTKLPAYDPTEYLTDEEVEAILEREQREAEAKFGSGAKAFDEHLHPRDAEGQFTETPDERLMISAGPMSGVKMTLGTLHEDDQQTVRNTLDRLGAKYPEAKKQIKSVAGAPLKTRWGSFDSSTGKMKFTNYGGKYEDFRDPTLEDTVTHEFGHAMVTYLAGWTPMNKPVRRTVEQGGQSLESWVQTVQTYNSQVRAFRDRRDAIVNDAYRRLKDSLGDRDIYEALREEFTDNPRYYASDKEELLAQAFSHWENGKHGPMADVVGPYFEELYRSTADE